MEHHHMNVTRGNGILEGFLARQRANLADRLIPEAARTGKILDIGCGTFPYFLMTTRFHEKYGLDKLADVDMKQFQGHNIFMHNHSLEAEERLPYGDGYFDVVTMLAVLEHIEPAYLVRTLEEVYRVTKPGGSYILTTPAAWTDSLLKILASVRLVSHEEIGEHKDTYSHKKIVGLLKQAGFREMDIQYRYFEAFMNLCVKALK